MSEQSTRPLDRNGIIIFAIPLAITTILAYVGDALAPSLLVSAPLVLILCNPRLRNLLIVVPLVGTWPFIIVSVVRLLATDPFFYWFGLRYGDVAIRWMEKRLGPGAFIVLFLERSFYRTRHVAVTVAPNQWICLLAGAVRMRKWLFWSLNIIGTVARVVLIWKLGDVFASPLLAISHWIGAHRLVLTSITVVIVLIGIAHNARLGRRRIETPSELAEEISEVGGSTTE